MPQNPPIDLVVFRLNGRLHGIPLAAVEGVVRSVQTIPVPDAPGFLTGMVDVRGQILPVIDLRENSSSAESGLGLGDRLILARSGTRRIALVADHVEGVVAGVVRQRLSSPEAPCMAAWVEGVARHECGMILLVDPDRVPGAGMFVGEGETLEGGVVAA